MIVRDLLGMVAMMIAACAITAADDSVPALCRERQKIPNVLGKLSRGDEVAIAYFGGSITEAPDGWRSRTLAWFKTNYPKAKIREIDAAIGGTGSDLGVYRCRRDVIEKRPDLVFVEFAVNDGGAESRGITRCMEGIVRQIWRENPETDICFVYTLHTGMCDDYEHGKLPRSAATMELVAEHYGIPSINVALKIVELAGSGKLKYRTSDATDSGGNVTIFSNDECHPRPEAHQVYSDVVTKAIHEMGSNVQPMPHQLKAPLAADNLERAKMIPVPPQVLSGSWQRLKTTEGLGQRFHPRMFEIWEGRNPGDRISFRFRGTTAKLYDLVGPDGGQAIVTVDGKAGNPIPRFDAYCTYPRLAVLPIAEDLPDGEHIVSIEIHPDQPSRDPVLKSGNEKPGYDPKKYDGTVMRVGYLMLVGDFVE